MSEDKDIGWMYQGAKALVNREDYLLGKKIDKNFEKYSDAVNEQKPEALDALLHTRTVVKPQPSAVKTSALENYVVATEDPLVAVKVKEETRRREVLENPLMKLKFQKMLKEMMAEREGKTEKKKKKKKRKDSVDDEKPKKLKKKKKSRESTEKSSTSETISKRKGSRHQPANILKGIHFRGVIPPLHLDLTQILSLAVAKDTRASEAMLENLGRVRFPQFNQSKGKIPILEARSHLLQFQVKDEKVAHPWNEVDVEDEVHLLLSREMMPKIARLVSQTANTNLEKPVEELHLLENDVFRVEIEGVVRGDLNHQNAGELLKSLTEAELQLHRNVQGGRHQDRREGVMTLLQHHPEETKKRVALKLETILHEQVRNGKEISVLAVDLRHLWPLEKLLILNLRKRARKRSAVQVHVLQHQAQILRMQVVVGKLLPRQKDRGNPPAALLMMLQLDQGSRKQPYQITRGIRKSSSQKEKRVRAFDSHIPEHLRPKGSGGENSEEEEIEDRFDREERERKKRFEGFGLVGVKKKSDDAGVSSENPYELSRKPTLPVYKKPERHRPLTEEEKQEKLREMMQNAAWRQETRNSNLKRARLVDEKEAEEDTNDKAPTFIRSQLNSAASDLTVEQRLQSNKKSLQRSHGFMEPKFTSK
ncbi:hypothetical protein Y032_0011g1499 [Ancylostoma ceylanicum]|uniref:Uncharacterized protein n=2 Tax=Ancylostoma ceylanicum TaxID=53326 RepID=A0A016VFC4_9BILA|nr:hypothetical protein Y032_0011g1499 [Ancylostoma ceylanicum]